MKRKPLIVKKASQHQADVFHFTFDGDCWWATFTIVEGLGEFSVLSDYGNYSYRWGDLGKQTLKGFLAGCNADYVLEKFSYSNKTDLADEIDYKETRKEWRKRIGERYADRRTHSRKSMAKTEVQDLLKEVDLLLEDEPPADIIFERMSGDLWAVFDNEPYEFVCHRRSPRWEGLRDQLLPFFFGYLKEQGHGRS